MANHCLGFVGRDVLLHIEKLHDGDWTRCGLSTEGMDWGSIRERWKWPAHTCDACLMDWRGDPEILGQFQREEQALQRANRIAKVKVGALAAGLLAFAVIVTSVVAGALDGGDDDGPSGWYTDAECEALRFQALSDDRDAVDAAAKYSVHCE